MRDAGEVKGLARAASPDGNISLSEPSLSGRTSRVFQPPESQTVARAVCASPAAREDVAQRRFVLGARLQTAPVQRAPRVLRPPVARQPAAGVKHERAAGLFFDAHRHRRCVFVPFAHTGKETVAVRGLVYNAKRRGATEKVWPKRNAPLQHSKVWRVHKRSHFRRKASSSRAPPRTGCRTTGPKGPGRPAPQTA